MFNNHNHHNEGSVRLCWITLTDPDLPSVVTEEFCQRRVDVALDLAVGPRGNPMGNPRITWDMGLSENVRVNIPNEIAIVHRDNDHENQWVQWGLAYFQTHPYL